MTCIIGWIVWIVNVIAICWFICFLSQKCPVPLFWIGIFNIDHLISTQNVWTRGVYSSNVLKKNPNPLIENLPHHVFPFTLFFFPFPPSFPTFSPFFFPFLLALSLFSSLFPLFTLPFIVPFLALWKNPPGDLQNYTKKHFMTFLKYFWPCWGGGGGEGDFCARSGPPQLGVVLVTSIQNVLLFKTWLTDWLTA